jgi:hypothetical protein
VSSSPHIDNPPPASELPPFVFVADHVGTDVPAGPEQPPTVQEGRLRRWSTGHTVAAAVVVVGVLATGGVALANRDPSAGTTGPGLVGPGAGQAPGGFGGQPRGGFGGQHRGGFGGQPPGGFPGQPPGQLPGAVQT